MIRITSLDDPRLAPYRDVADPAAIARAGRFVAEGRWVVQRLLARPHFETESVLVTPPAHTALLASHTRLAADVPVFVVDQPVMDKIVGFHIHRGCLALARRPPLATLDDTTLTNLNRVIVLEGVNNPDNVGGIFRSAAAFGSDLIVLGPGCGDPLYRKAIRTSMAATLDVPYVTCGPWPDALQTISAAGLHLVALTPAADATPLESLAPDARIALLLGTEGSGLTEQALAHADLCVRIRMTDRVDSLNVTVAASIALYHLFTTRRTQRN